MRLFVYSMREFDELPCFEKFCAKYDIDFDYTTQTPCLENLKLCAGYEVVDIITTIIDRPMLDEFHRLGVRCLTTRTIGYDHIDTEYAKQLGIGVAHVSYSPNSVADYTIMLMLMGCRRMKHIMERAAVQDYTLKGKLGREIQDCTVGIIGTGRIGKTLIRHLSGFGCKMLAYDIYESDEVKEFAQYADLDTIYRDCDIITLHAPATEDNYHMIDACAIEKMKPGVMLINCARGSLVDTDALIDGIENGKIGFAGLDVIEHESGLYYFNRMGEPLHNPKLAILRSYSNVIVSPHTAFYTDEAVANMAENSILGAISFMKGEENPFLLQ
ncbi:MAG: D-isomer specific 2-hydroxyacid dehydrogenase family protein [Lachnospiraceae bacterium]|nr:D-isomer specific 2-hydroxyacid dehydrogenase family protein [Lachnospiraceae bacterium]